MSSIRSTRPTTFAITLLFLFALCLSPVLAQAPVISPTSALDSDQATETDSAVKPAEPAYGENFAPSLRKKLESPYKTFKTFIEETSENDYSSAGLCLDLSQIDESKRASERDMLAYQLRAIVDRLALVEWSEVPDTADGVPYTFQPNPQVPPIVITKNEAGLWLFSKLTVSRIPEIYETVKDWPPLRGTNWLRDMFPDWMLHVTFLLPDYQWIALLIVIILGVVGDFLSRLIAAKLLAAWFRFRKTDYDSTQERKVFRPMGLLIRALIWYGGLVLIQFPPTILMILSAAVQFFAVIAAVWTSYCVIDLLADVARRKTSKTETKFDDILVPLITRSMKVFVTCIGIVTFAQAFDIPIAGLLSGLGIGGLAFAFAAKDTIGNIFGSVTVLIDRPFEIGDWIITDQCEGSVESVGMRSTRVRTFYNSVVTVPNSLLVTAVVDNMGKRSYRRYKTLIGLEYGTQPERIDAFCEGIRELIRRHPYTRKDYYHVYLNGFGAHSLDVLLYCFFECPDWAIELRERHRLICDILKLADAMQIGIAFPTQTINLRQDETPATPDSLPDPMLAGQKHAAEIAGPLLKGADRPGSVEF